MSEPPVEGTNTSSTHVAVPTAGPVASTSVGPIVPHSSSTVQAASSGFPPQLLASTISSPLALQPTLRTPLTGTRVTEAPAFLPTFVPSSVSQLGFPGTSLSFPSASCSPLLATSTTPVVQSVGPTPSNSILRPSLGLPSTSYTAPFVVGPGFTPVSPKLVNNIVRGQFVDLPLLIQEASEEEPPCILLEGQLVINPGPRKTKQLTDIISWVQAFSIYASIFCVHYPHRARDLWLYQLFIVRIARQFRGLTWANYDKAFRRDAAARNVTDWSQMNVELFHYHSATSRLEIAQPRRSFIEARGSPSSQFLCRSWNRGRCSASSVCRYRHACDVVGCSQDHRGIEHNRSGSNNESRAQFIRDRPAKRSSVREYNFN